MYPYLDPDFAVKKMSPETKAKLKHGNPGAASAASGAGMKNNRTFLNALDILLKRTL